MAVFYPQFGQVHLAGVRFGAIVPITGAPNHSDCDMNLARIESYLQTVVLGALLILAVVADQIRLKYVASLKD